MAALALSAAAQRVSLRDVSFPARNGCTGNMATTTLSNGELVMHDDVDLNGGQHLCATVTGDVSDSEGFSGWLTYTYGQNVEGSIIVGEFRGFILLGNTTFTLQDGSGRLLLVHGITSEDRRWRERRAHR